MPLQAGTKLAIEQLRRVIKKCLAVRTDCAISVAGDFNQADF